MADPREGWRRDRDRARDEDRGGREGERNWPGREWRSREDWDRGRDFDPFGRGYGPDRGFGRRAISGGVPGGAWGFDESWGRDPGWERGWRPTGYGNAGYGRDRYGERVGYANRPQHERNWWNRASDEVSSWFGDESAERRRQDDQRPEPYYERDDHRGRGPRGYTRSNERITEDVNDRLTDNPILDASDIEVVTADGEVTLSGSVDSRYSKRLAEDIAHDVSGVRDVQNNLRIRRVEQQRESISGTASGIAEGGRTSDMGRTSGSGIGGSSGVGDTAGSMTGSSPRPGDIPR